MATNNTTNSDLYSLYNIVQSSMIVWPKELVIQKLKDFFSRDSMYHFATDHFGFPQTPDHTNLPQTAGYKDSLTARLYINSAHRYDVVYYPAIIVRHGGATSVPISFNRERACIQWDTMVFEDGYGNQKRIPYPISYIFAGAWEGSITIEVITRDPRSRDDLVELISMLFTQIAADDMEKDGVAIKPGGVSAGAPSEGLDRTDTLFKTMITLQFRSEWRRLIPVRNVIDSINTSIEFGRVDNSSPVSANLTINTQQTLTDLINKL
jgi:hypothetical protein